MFYIIYFRGSRHDWKQELKIVPVEGLHGPRQEARLSQDPHRVADEADRLIQRLNSCDKK
jgi:hypothetical protein